MLFVRTFDSKSIALQRTGKLGTYAACLGHEAHVGIGAAMQKDDVFAPSYREYGAMFMRGVRPHDVRCTGAATNAATITAATRPRTSVLRADLHPVPACRRRGAEVQAQQGTADRGGGVRRRRQLKTDFYAALNSAGAYKLPLILCIVNNGWAISVPRSAQTGAETLAQKGLAGGLHCLQVDGNDLIAVLAPWSRRANVRWPATAAPCWN